MERLKITLISLTITILTFMFGPLVLSALLYYAYTYCDNRPKKETELKPVSSLYGPPFFALPFIIFYLSKQFDFQEELFEILRFVFSFKVIEMYNFSCSEICFDNLFLFSIAHVVSTFTVSIFSFYMAKYRKKMNMGLPSYNENSVDEKRLTEGKKVIGVLFFFFVLLGLVVIYYFSFKDTVVSESKFYREGLLNVVFFPGYIIFNVVFFSVLKAKLFVSSN